jgi:hypothetical protein
VVTIKRPAEILCRALRCFSLATLFNFAQPPFLRQLLGQAVTFQLPQPALLIFLKLTLTFLSLFGSIRLW